MRKFYHVIAIALCTAGTASHVACAADDWPTRTITYVSAFQPGSNTDLLARIIAPKLSVALKVPIIVENRSGAGGMIGSAFVARAPADGYTILGASIATHAIAPALYKNMQYDALKSFAPITVIGTNANVLIVGANSPYKSVKQIIDAARAKPGKLSFGSSGIGTTQHLSGELLQKQAHIKMIHVPYSKSPAIQDVMSGQLDMMFEGPTAIPHVKSGSVRALAVTSTKRIPSLPDVPTLEEAGVPDYEINAWQAVFAPAGTPPAIVHRLQREIAAILKAPDVAQKLNDLGVEASGMSPEAFAQFQEKEIEKWRTLIRASNVTVD
jgi:tripartite-type tricarboxylate transporter receptor subunit TctC